MRERLSVWKALPVRQRWMIVLLALGIILGTVKSPYPAVAPLHHVPTVFVVFVAPWLLRRWPLSDGAVAAILVFLLLHTLGGRYTYSNVPYDQFFGFSITETFGFRRNHYDRLVHVAFGVLAIAPMREILTRHAGFSRAASFYGAISFVLSVSALYEIFEWLLTIVVAGPTADAYNGQQGDIWDSQKDMALLAMAAFLTAGSQAFRGKR